MNCRFVHFLSIVAGVVLSPCVAGLGVAATHITVRDRIAVATPVVRVGDVADVASADRDEARRLAAMPLMPAPAPGTERFLAKREIEDLLSARGLDLSQLRFAGAAQVAISAPAEGPIDGSQPAGQLSNTSQPMNRHAAILAGQLGGAPGIVTDESVAATLREELNRTVTSYLVTQTGQDQDWRVTCEMSARQLAMFQAATAPLVCQGGCDPWTGRQRFLVSFDTARGPIQIPVIAEVEAASVQAVVAIRPIARGDVITAADVEMQTLETTPSFTGRRAAVDSVEKLIGMEARQAIQAGDVIRMDQIQAPLLVKRGEIVTVVSQSGSIRVRTTARARQDGAQGELIQVESLEAKERYDVRVVGLREAAVFVASQPVIQTPPKQIETARADSS